MSACVDSSTCRTVVAATALVAIAPEASLGLVAERATALGLATCHVEAAWKTVSATWSAIKTGARAIGNAVSACADSATCRTVIAATAIGTLTVATGGTAALPAVFANAAGWGAAGIGVGVLTCHGDTTCIAESGITFAAFGAAGPATEGLGLTGFASGALEGLIGEGTRQVFTGKFEPARLALTAAATGIIGELADYGTTRIRQTASDFSGFTKARIDFASERGSITPSEFFEPPSRDSINVVEDATEAGSSVGGSGEVERVADFANDRAAFGHYAKHVQGVELGPNGSAIPKVGGPDLPEFSSFGEYRSGARAFMGGGADEGVLEGFRSNGDLLRLDPKSGHFGIRSRQGIIRTFFRPDRMDPIDYFQQEVVK